MGKRLYLYDQTNKETRLEGIEQRYSSYKELYTMGLGPKRFQFGPRKEVREKVDYRDIINQFMQEVRAEPGLLEKLKGKPVCVWTRVICDYAELKELTETPRVKLYRQVYSWLRHRITYEPKPKEDKEQSWGKLDPRKKAYQITEARYTRIEVEVVNKVLFQRQDE